MLEKYIQGISKAVYNIYTGDESWIYAYEPETKQQSTVWVFQDEAKPTKVVRGRSTSKQMIACFFGINGHVATVALEQRRTVNSEWYTTICLPEVIGEIRKKQKNRRIILHHDNASSHTSTQTKAFLTERKIELMGPLVFETQCPINGWKRETVNAQRHLVLLLEKIVPSLREKDELSTVMFMQDGGTSHTANAVKEFLIPTFGKERIIIKFYKFLWPSWSPDRKPADFWL
ncbi:hypothetical protein NPIL_465461 [Nephila pilipes]|uniref:Transposase n=1 Tax=Nephila pilipes TaxID=299642 RepID=A0A8X6QXV9_NEPPI|nr:hypothetical protein NPIL_465461 [Nephila pilipes]